MWAQKWGSLVWGNASPAVPVMGFWFTLLFGVVMGAVGVFALKKAPARTAAMLGGALVALVPLSALAVPFVFSNGTVADATQVNSNFASLKPVTGMQNIPGTPNGALWRILGDFFLTPRAMVCTVTTTVVTTLSEPVDGVAIITPVKSENEVVSKPLLPPQSGVPFVYLMPAAGTGVYQGTITVQYNVAAASFLEFGVEMNTTGNFITATTNWKMLVVHVCN